MGPMSGSLGSQRCRSGWEGRGRRSEVGEVGVVVEQPTVTEVGVDAKVLFHVLPGPAAFGHDSAQEDVLVSSHDNLWVEVASVRVEFEGEGLASAGGSGSNGVDDVGL